MAVAYASSEGASLPALGSTTLTITKPSGTVAGDLLLVYIINSANTVMNPVESGWNLSVSAAGIRAYWKVAGGSEPASYGFTRAAMTNSMVGTMARITGAHSSTPIDTFASAAGGSGTTVVIPTVTVATGFYLFQMALVQSASTFTPPGTATEDYDTQVATQNFGTAGGHETVAAGATGSRTWTASTTGVRAGGMWAIIAAPPPVHSGSGSLEASVDLAGAGSTTRSGSGALEASVDLAGAGSTTRSGSGALEASVDLAGAGSTTHSGSGALEASADLTGAGSTAYSGSGALEASVDLAGAGSTVRSGSGALEASVDLTGAGEMNPAGSGALDVSVGLAGTGGMNPAGSGAITVHVVMTGGAGEDLTDVTMCLRLLSGDVSLGLLPGQTSMELLTDEGACRG